MTAPLLTHGGTACRRVEDAFYACLSDHGMGDCLSRGTLLAFSGGMDSLLLFHLLAAHAKVNRYPFAAAHIHHGIRGESADRDLAFCRQVAEAAGVLFFSSRVDTPARAKESGRGIEETARELRYAALSAIMAEQPAYGTVALAHHATDNLETVLFHFLRGAGVRGMCGIPPVRGPFVRPLLYVPRRDIEAAVAELGLSYVTDESNADEDYDRNYIRKNVLPHLYHLRPDPEGATLRLGANLREEAAVGDLAAKEFWQTHVHGLSADRVALCHLPQAVAFRVLLRLFAACGAPMKPERVHIISLLDILQSGPAVGECPMPGGYHAAFDQKEITFQKEKKKPASFYDIPLQMGENKLGESGGTLWLFPGEMPEFENDCRNVYNLFIQAKLDSATIMEGLHARPRVAGDAYRTRGMTRRVRRLMSEAGMPQDLRAVLPLVCDARGILWVPGLGLRDGEKAGQDPLYIYYTYGKKDKDPAGI